MVYFMRQLLKPVPLKSAVLIVSVISTAFLVSIPSVIGNMSRLSWGEQAGYFGSSFLKAGPVVDLALVLAAFAAVWLAYDIARNMKYIKIALFHRKALSSIE
jgi:hypothetical protein